MIRHALLAMLAAALMLTVSTPTGFAAGATVYKGTTSQEYAVTFKVKEKAIHYFEIKVNCDRMGITSRFTITPFVEGDPIQIGPSGSFYRRFPGGDTLSGQLKGRTIAGRYVERLGKRATCPVRYTATR